VRVDPHIVLERTVSHGGRVVPFQATGDWDGKIVRQPDIVVTAIGAGTTYPDYKPAPFIVSSEIDGVDMVTVVTEGIFSYCGVKVKIDTDRYLGAETAIVRAQGEAVGHVTTSEYGSQMLSLGGVHHLTGGSKKEGRVTCDTLMDLSNCKPVELKVDGGATVIVEAGRPPIVNGVTEERMRVGCGSATIGMFAKQWHGKVDEVVVVDDHITGVLSEHQAGKLLDIADTGIKMKGRRSTPGRYFQVAEPGTGWGGTNISDPLAILGPFDYTHEQNTRNLYVSEGMTSYWAAIGLKRSGVWSLEDYYDDLTRQISTLQSAPGRKIMSVELSSWDTWNRGDNATNNRIDYYNKGQLIGNLLDLEIRHRTGNKRSLTDVFVYLMKNHGLPNPGFEEKHGFRDAVELITREAAPSSPDFGEFFAKYVSGTEEIPWNAFFEHAGLMHETVEGFTQLSASIRRQNESLPARGRMNDANAGGQGEIGARTYGVGYVGQVECASVERGSVAYVNGDIDHRVWLEGVVGAESRGVAPELRKHVAPQLRSSAH